MPIDTSKIVDLGVAQTLYNDLRDRTESKYTKPSTGIPASDLASGVIPDVSGKADKVSNATNGNFASLDANGNLTDSGHKHSDYLTSHQDISGKADKADTVLTTTLSMGRKANTTVGTNSTALGNSVEASGSYSFAEGWSSKATAIYSHAEGNASTASNTAAHSEGSATASGAYSHAEGGGTTASGNYAHSEGGGTTASGDWSHVEGNAANASGESAHAEGAHTTASGGKSHSEGQNTLASGSYSHAEGFGGSYDEGQATNVSSAVGTADHTEGYQCLTANGQPGNHAEGYRTKATGGASHSEGSMTTASGVQAHSEGAGTTASGPCSHAEGNNTIASGDLAHVEGDYTIASGMASHVVGRYNVDDIGSIPEWTANTAYAVGDKVKRIRNNLVDTYECITANSDSVFDSSKWNTLNGKGIYVEIVGNGNSAARSNARTLDWDGNERLMGDVYVRCNADSTGGTMVPHDVQVNGTSVVNNGIANVPVAEIQSGATASNLGVVKVRNGYDGLTLNTVGNDPGRLMLYPTQSNQIKAGSESYLAVTVARQHESTFYGLAKVAGADEKNSTNPVGTYTPQAKAAIQSMLGVSSASTVSGKADKVSSATNGNFAGLDSNGNLTDSGHKHSDYLLATQKGANSGIAELDANGKVPSSQLPSYVDDVIEGYYYNSKFYKESTHTTEITGETGKIYIDLSTEKTYRWSGTAYAEISASLALGTTSSTAFRGDYGNTAYSHATDSSRLTTAQSSGLYKFATTSEGHIASVTAVSKSDITALGIPAQDTTYESKAAASGGTDVSLVTTGEKYTWNNKYSKPSNGIPASDLASGVIPDVPVQDVQVGGTSVLSNGVASIPSIPEKTFPFGQVDSTSTSTVFTATVPGITELKDGVMVYLRNNVVTSASGFTININNLGAKPVYQNLAAESRVTTLFNINYTMLFIYNSTRVEGGCWDMYYGYNSNDNTLAYNVRNNAAVLKMAEQLTRYKIVFTKMDGTLLPCTQTSNSTGTTKTLTTTAFNPFAPIYYYQTTTTVAADASPGTAYMWVRYTGADLRYGFNKGSTLVAQTPVYIRCVPQSDGSVKLDGNDCIVQALPSTADNKVYIYLGNPYDTYRIVLEQSHPVYEYKDGAIRLWTNTNVPSKTSDLTNDSGYITTETDPTVPAWAKASTKPSYTASEVGALPSNTTYVSTVNGASGAVTIDGLPAVTSADNGKVLMVVNGQWAAVSLSQANGVSF